MHLDFLGLKRSIPDEIRRSPVLLVNAVYQIGVTIGVSELRFAVWHILSLTSRTQTIRALFITPVCRFKQQRRAILRDEDRALSDFSIQQVFLVAYLVRKLEG
jgi:hypothetical protein